jgi:hypothetical protein
MNRAAPPRWFPPLSLLAVGLIAGLLSFSAWRTVPFAVTGQAIVLIILVRAFCYWPPLVQWLRAMPIAHRLAFGALLGAMILGHYTLNGRAYFPFVTWEIFPFVREDDPVTCREMIATTASGQKVRLLAEQLVPSIVQTDALESYSPQTTEDLIRALARLYNERHADDPVQHVDLLAMAVRLHPPAGESREAPSCEFLKRYDISSGRSN